MADTLSQRLQRRMAEAGLNQRSLALRAGLHEDAVRNIFRGKSLHPRHDTLERLADALGCSVGDLIGAPREGGKTPPETVSAEPGAAAKATVGSGTSARGNAHAAPMGRERAPQPPSTNSGRSAAAPSARRRRGAMAWLAIALAAIVVGGGLYGAWPEIVGRVTGPETTGPEVAIANGETRAALARRDEAAVPSAPETATDRGDVAGRPSQGAPSAARDEALIRLAERLGALERAVAARGTTREVAALAGRLDALEARAAAPGRAEVAVAALDGRLAALESGAVGSGDPARLAALRRETAKVEAAIGELGRRLSALERRAATGDRDTARAVAFIISVGELRAALKGAGPYAEALEAVRAGFGADVPDALAAIADRAERGIPTIEGLRARFARLAGDIVRAGAMPEDADWIDETVGRLKQMVTVRRTGLDVAGDSPDALVARAEAALAAGDLAGAVAALGTLQGPAASAAAPWLGDARARIAAGRALAAVNTRLTRRVKALWPVAGRPQAQ